MNPILEQLKRQFKQPENAVMQLIIINVAVFILIGLTNVILTLAGFAEGATLIFTRKWLALSDNPLAVLYKPWTLITYSFVHLDLGHIFFNCLGLYFLGQFFISELGGKKLIGLYLLGAVGAGLFFLLVDSLFYYYNASIPVIGASGSIIAFLIALATLRPHQTVRLFFILPVKLMWLAIGSVVIFTLNIVGENGGGEIAHVGGALVGFVFAKLYLRGTDITKPVVIGLGVIQRIFKPKPKMKVTYKSKGKTKTTTNVEDVEFAEISQEEIDTILDKLKVSGYSSLTDKEKRTLFEYSKQ